MPCAESVTSRYWYGYQINFASATPKDNTDDSYQDGATSVTARLRETPDDQPSDGEREHRVERIQIPRQLGPHHRRNEERDRRPCDDQHAVRRPDIGRAAGATA